MNRTGPFLFQEALAETSGDVIVEIGVIRDKREVASYSDGHSTIAWADSGKHVYCVDLSRKAIAVTEAILGDNRDNVTTHVCDGVEFLKSFDDEIDLLYLDGPDPDGCNYGQEFARDCVINAPMRSCSVILIDDCDLPDFGKGKYAIGQAESMGYTLHMPIERQALLVRKLK